MKRFPVKYFEHIPATPQKGLILTRLGYRRGVTRVNESYRQDLDRRIQEALLLCHLRGAYGLSGILRREEGFVALENGLVIPSEKLALFLKDSHGVVFMAATAGREIGETVAGEMSGGDGALGVVYDAVASQVVDTALDWIMNFVGKSLGMKGECLTRRRFSPGYGDLDLCWQKVIYDLLDLKKLEVAITEKFMLEPEKTVLAIAGIGVAHE